MRYPLLMRFLFLTFLLLCASLHADESPDTIAPIRERAMEHQKAGRFAAAVDDFIKCIEEGSKTNRTGRRAEYFARIAYNQTRMGNFKDARENMEKAPRQNGWKDEDPFLMEMRAIVFLATDQIEPALQIAQKFKAVNPKKAEYFEMVAQFFGGDEKCLATPLGRFLFDPEQLLYNGAVARNPKDLIARRRRAAYFLERANQQRFPNSYPAKIPVDRGGWAHLFDPATAAGLPYSFYASAFYDLSRALEMCSSQDEPFLRVRRAGAAYGWNAVAPKNSLFISAATIAGDLKRAQKQGALDVRTQRALGDFFSETLPPVDQPNYRPRLRSGIQSYSRALYFTRDESSLRDPDWLETPETDSLQKVRAARSTLIGFHLSGKPVALPDLPPLTELAWKDYGNTLVAREELGSALEAYKKALEFDPEFVPALNNIGTVYSRLGAFDIALEWFDKAVKADPKFAIGWTNRAGVLDELGDVEKSLASYDTALGIEPQNAQTWVSRGILAMNSKSWASGQNAFAQAARLAPQNSRYAALSAFAKFANENAELPKIDLSIEDKTWLSNFFGSDSLAESYASKGAADKVFAAREWIK
ncbi:tetratricopeptide repeat protein [bacterium]|nr:MAG: tetratricopeptide repeat protein [bacterium]